MSTGPAPSPAPGDPEESTQTVEIRAEVSGAMIGPYRVISQLGEGGMGLVYYAQQSHPIRRGVALKIIKPGMDTRQVIARFETERQALAVMDHPNIARVLDAGSTDAGRPYFVMEMVNGVPITRYCDTRRLTVRERIELLIPVCDAIQHAHQKGVIHRDIKPSNILIAELEGKPSPKVIDFGLAKALGPEMSDATEVTGLGTVVGTLEYMSPEQAKLTRRDIDTRSDVYSLGVVLYELLTGTTPLERERLQKAGYVEALQSIREEEAPSPSVRMRRSTSSSDAAAQRQTDPQRLPRLLRGELDWIAMKALEKDRARRYQTVNSLARDLQRYLAREPVEAAPPSSRYRLAKFVRRHRAALSVAAAFLALLVTGAVVSARMAIRATRAEQEARAVNDFLRNDLLAQASARRQAQADGRSNPHLEVRTAVDRAAARIGGKFASEPLVEAAIRQTIADTYMDLGVYQEAQKHAQRALALRRQAVGDTHPDTLASMFTLGIAYENQEVYPQAESLLTKVVQGRKDRLGGEHPDTLKTMARLGEVYDFAGKYDRAEELLNRTLRIQRRTLGEEHAQTLDSMFGLANVYNHQAKYAQAESLFGSLWGIRRRVLGEDHPDTLSTANNLAVVYFRERKFAEAGSIFQTLADANRRVSGEEHPRTLNSLTNLAATYQMQGKYDEAKALLIPLLETQRRLRGPESPAALNILGDLGELYCDQGSYAQAEPLLVQALAGTRHALGDHHRSTAVAMRRLGVLYREQGKYVQAEPLLAGALAVRRSVFGEGHPETVESKVDLGEVKMLQRNFAEADALLGEALRNLEKSGDWMRYRCQSVLGASLAGQKKYAEAEQMLQSGYDGMLQRRSSLSIPENRYLVRAGEGLAKLRK